MNKESKDKLLSLLKRRGFLWPSYEIYGGLAGFISYGPLGVKLKRKIEDLWRNIFIKKHGFIEIDAPTIGPIEMYEATGFLESFKDKVGTCIKCNRKWRIDHLIEEQTKIPSLEIEKLPIEKIQEIIENENVKCPICGGEIRNISFHSLMFKTTVGPFEDRMDFLRPETAQGIFTEFIKEYELSRKKLPIGVAQIGKCFRNEISPRQGPIRLREFTIMELELMFDPEEPECPYLKEAINEKIRILTASQRLNNVNEPKEYSLGELISNKIVKQDWQAYFMYLSNKFINILGIPNDKTFFLEKLPEERAHYAQQVFDQLVYSEIWGWIEVSGHAYRSDFDLSRHSLKSGIELKAFRKYSIPKKIKKINIKPNIKKIKEFFGDKSSIILSKLNNIDNKEIEEKINKNGYIKIDDIVLSKELFEIIEIEETLHGESFIPHVVEPSFGVDRVTYITLEYAYNEKENRIVMNIPIKVAPIEIAVFPLLESKNLIEKSIEIYNLIMENGFEAIYDESGYIGRRYARADEEGIPICITIDHQTIEDNTVTFRDRNTWIQKRVPIKDIIKELNIIFKKERHL
ncbi:MAG: glycine--tRNA ligase [Nitrososphaerota archaeon]